MKLLKEQREIIRLTEHTVNKTDSVGCLLVVDLLILTSIFCLISGALLLLFTLRCSHPTTRALPAFPS